MTQTSRSEKPDRLLKTNEVASWLGISPSTLYAWVRDGRFPAPVVLGDPEDKRSTTRFIKSEIEQWLFSRPREKTDDGKKPASRPTGLWKNLSPDPLGTRGASARNKS